MGLTAATDRRRPAACIELRKSFIVRLNPSTSASSKKSRQRIAHIDQVADRSGYINSGVRQCPRNPASQPLQPAVLSPT
ncbi:MAG: hypothetical protein EBX53_10530, partial [Betaproteobacteria bacterium]|nr:hypothetical protein [Betaproteobacteria bacterium]